MLPGLPRLVRPQVCLPISPYIRRRQYLLPFKGGGYGCLFSLEGIDPESRTDEDLDVRVRGVEAALRGLPQGLAASCQYTRVIWPASICPRQKQVRRPQSPKFLAANDQDHVSGIRQLRFRRIDLHWCLTIEPDAGTGIYSAARPKEHKGLRRTGSYSSLKEGRNDP